MNEEMIIRITFENIIRRVQPHNWERFCDDFHYNVYVVNEGGGDIEVNLTEDQAKEYGIL